MGNDRRIRNRRSPAAFAQGALAIIAWLVIWQLIAVALANPWLLSGPVETARTWGQLVLTAGFWQAVASSIARIAIGYGIAFIAGCVLGYLAAKLPGLRTFLKPAILVVKSAPVVCVIALLLVAVGSHVTTAIVVGLVVFPQFYHAVMESVLARDSEVDKVLDVFGVPGMRRALCVELVAFGASVRAATATAAGLAWKSGVAAELIGLRGISIGEGVYLAKISLDSASIIAWTATVIVLSWLSEKFLLALVDGVMRLPGRWLDARVRRALAAKGADAPMTMAPADLRIEGLACTYDTDSGTPLRLDYEDLTIAAGARLCVMAPSGAGKTTLLSMVTGIKRPSAGTIAYDNGQAPAMAAVLQDCTLLPWASALENIALVAKDASEIRRGAHLCRAMLDEETLAKPARALSGGMRRRAELARALAHPSSIVILDEPFAGLDAATKERCIRLIDEELDGRTLIIATHDEADAAALGCDIARL